MNRVGIFTRHIHAIEMEVARNIGLRDANGVIVDPELVNEIAHSEGIIRTVAPIGPLEADIYGTVRMPTCKIN